MWEAKTPILTDIESVVENGAFAHYEHTFHFPPSFKKSSAMETLKGVSME